MEQEKKATEKKYEEMELKMEDDRRSQEVKMMKMEEKMKKEFRQQQEEFNRAQDHNLKEQKALLEQGFKEKADLMRRQMEQAQEMQMLKNEIDRLKRRKPKNCVIS